MESYVQRELPSQHGDFAWAMWAHTGCILYGDEFRNYDHVPTATRLSLAEPHQRHRGPLRRAGFALWSHGAASLIDRPYPAVRQV